MSVTGPAQSAVDWVNPVNWGPWGPLAVTQGVAPGVPAQRGRRLNAGDAKCGGAAREVAGKHLQGTVHGVFGRVRKLRLRRVQRWWLWRQG